MARQINIKKGLNINLLGEAEKNIADLPIPGTFAIKPTDFIGVTPKILVNKGDEVHAGSPLFYDKNNEQIKFCSPVSGEIIDVIRGEKRRILEIKILADKEIVYTNFDKIDVQKATREDIINT